MGVEYFRLGRSSKGDFNSYDGFYFKTRGTAEYFGKWLQQQGRATKKGTFRQAGHARRSIRSFVSFLGEVFAICPEVHELLTPEAEAFYSVGERLR
eukprot:13302340-Alexandrium_andersonii.AAC.1